MITRAFIDSSPALNLSLSYILTTCSERSYIGPTTAPWGADQVKDFPHLGFLGLTKYFTQAYKTGTYPTVEYSHPISILYFQLET